MLIRLVLAIEDSDLRESLASYFENADVHVESHGPKRGTWQRVTRSCGDIVVVSEGILPDPLESGISILNNLPENPVTVILCDDDSSAEQAQLVASGADVVLYKDLPKDRLAEAIEATLESRRQFLQKDRFDRMGRIKPKISDFVSESEVMRIFMEEVRQVIPSDSLLLVLGETGVGKEHLAKAIHAESPRSAGPFVVVNAAALPEQLLESELFGHEQGAFTGAIRSRRGAFELAHGGTIFLDEIGELPLHLQTKLLRVLQDYEVRPVGGEKPVWVDVRVLVATNQNLEEAVEEGRFRKDLYYRLSVVTLTVPPLRQRREDIPVLARRFVDLSHNRSGHEVRGLSDRALRALGRYGWPGNVRELKNVIERAILLSKSQKISMVDLPHVFHDGAARAGQVAPGVEIIPETWKGRTLPEVSKEVLERVERIYLEMTLKETRGRVGRAAEMAGVHPRGLYDKMKRLGLRKEDFKGG
jgi:DNA-binding NtrC family response regulator